MSLQGSAHASLLSGVTQPQQYTVGPYRKVHRLQLEDGTPELPTGSGALSSSYTAALRVVRLLAFGGIVSMASVTLSGVLDNSGAS